MRYVELYKVLYLLRLLYLKPPILFNQSLTFNESSISLSQDYENIISSSIFICSMGKKII